MSGPGDSRNGEPRPDGNAGEIIELSSRRKSPRPAGAIPGDDEPEPDRRASTVALVVALVIVVVGYLLITEIFDNTKIDDCNLAGRKNCVPIEVPAHRSSLPWAAG